MAGTHLTRALHGALATLLTVSAFLACGDSDSNTAASSDGGTAPDSSLPSPFGDGSTGGSCDTLGLDDGCTGCIEQSCCTEAKECDGEPECMALVECARDCTGADAGGCKVACLDEHGQGLNAYNGLIVCMADQCLSECPYTTP